MPDRVSGVVLCGEAMSAAGSRQAVTRAAATCGERNSASVEPTTQASVKDFNEERQRLLA